MTSPFKWERFRKSNQVIGLREKSNKDKETYTEAEVVEMMRVYGGCVKKQSEYIIRGHYRCGCTSLD